MGTAGRDAGTIPLLARSSKGLTGWVTKYPLRGDVAKESGVLLLQYLEGPGDAFPQLIGPSAFRSADRLPRPLLLRF